MNINWRQPDLPKNIIYNRNNEIIFSKLLNSMISLFVPNSNILFKKIISEYKLKLYNTKFSYNDLIILYLKFKTIPGNNFIQKLLYTIGSDSSISYFYVKIKINNTEISEFISYKSTKIDIEPKDIILSPNTKIFGIQYIFDNLELKKKLKIQETFKNFKLNSIFTVIEKAYSIVKIKKIWYIYDDIIGFIVIPYSINKNIIVFEPVKVNGLIFSFDKVKECVIFYMKYKNIIYPKPNVSNYPNPDISNNYPKPNVSNNYKPTIFNNIYMECNCAKDLGWRQLTKQFCMSGGICWFDAGMMALLVPIKLRKIFLESFYKKYKIPKDKLFPCNENFNTNSSDKANFIKSMTNVNVNKDGDGIYKIPQILFSGLDDNIRNIPLYLKDKKKFFKYLFNKDIFKYTPRYTLININGYDDFDLKYNYFSISLKNYEPPKENLLGFELQSITVGFELYENDEESGHSIALIKCKHGWFLYDDNLALYNKNMIELNPSNVNGCLIFKPIRYNYNELSNTPWITFDISKSEDLMYNYAK